MAKKRKKKSPTKHLFRDPSGQEHMFEKSLRDGAVLEATGERTGKIGIRHSVLCDLSPIASFVAARYNNFRRTPMTPVGRDRIGENRAKTRVPRDHQ